MTVASSVFLFSFVVTDYLDYRQRCIPTWLPTTIFQLHPGSQCQSQSQYVNVPPRQSTGSMKTMIDGSDVGGDGSNTWDALLLYYDDDDAPNAWCVVEAIIMSSR